MKGCNMVMDVSISGFISIKEAAEILGVTKNTLRNWEAAGKIKVYRNPYNNYRLYKKEEIVAFLKSIEDQEAYF